MAEPHKHWRLWHRLFGWDYAEIHVFATTGANKGKMVHSSVCRIRLLPDGRRYYLEPRNCKHAGSTRLLDDAREVIPLTFVDKDEELARFAARVADSLVGEDK